MFYFFTPPKNYSESNDNRDTIKHLRMKKPHVNLQIAKCNKRCGKILVNSSLCKYNWTSKNERATTITGNFW